MSIFDQFNANPYIRTYAGAPINEAMQVASALTQRAETNIANMDKMMLMADAMPTMGAADKAYKAQYMADLNRQIEEISQAPEHATSKVRRLATKTAMDPTLKSIQATAAASAKWQSEFAKDPGKYGDVAAWEFQKAQQAYEAAGGAQGGAVFQAPALYELKDLNKFLIDNGKAIAANEEGVAYEDGKFIHEKTREEIHPDRVRGILEGAIGRDSGFMRQLDRERQMYNEMNGTDTNIADYVSQQVEPYVHTFAYSKGTHKMKGAPGASGSGGNNMPAASMFTYLDDEVQYKTNEEFSSGADMYRAEREMRDSDNPEDINRSLHLKAARQRTIQKAASNGTINEMQAQYLNEMGLDAVMEGDDDYRGRAQNWAKQQGMSEGDAMRFGTEMAQLFTNSWFADDMVDFANDANTFALPTKYRDIWAESGMTSTVKKNIDLGAQRELSAMRSVTMLDPETGAPVELSREEFAEKYDISTASLGPVEVNGTGLSVVRFKNREDGDDDAAYIDLKIKFDPERSGTYRYAGQYLTNKANNADLGSPAQLEAAGEAINIISPATTQAFEFSAPGIDSALDFGSLTPVIVNHFGGDITAGMDENGNYVAKLNGRNLFENNEKYLNLAKGANAKEMAALTMQYLREVLVNQ